MSPIHPNPTPCGSNGLIQITGASDDINLASDIQSITITSKSSINSSIDATISKVFQGLSSLWPSVLKNPQIPHQ